jgi:eukaryotic-like serine/threonine-protein kinase
MARTRHRVTEQRDQPSILGGREELRATLLKPYLLQLREERGDTAARALLSTVGLASSMIEDETAWISVAAARRALSSLATALGDEAIAHCAPWIVHAEALGVYVQMLRVSSEPMDAFRYVTAHAAETTRVGTYRLAEFGKNRIEIEYTPSAGLETDQNDRLLCIARAAELEALTLFWGLPPATVTHLECLAQGDSMCRYSIKWVNQRSYHMWLGVGGGAIAAAAPIALTGNWLATVIGTFVGSGLGGIIGRLADRIAGEKQSRVLEKHRILALERGLELRGQNRLPEGELIGTVLGGKYRILRRIGSGGIGAVYAAEHVALGHRVAVKLLRGAAAADASETARLRREAQLQVSIEHPNVVRTLDLDQTPDGSIYVVMELLRGVSLAERLREGPVSPGQAVPMFISVCRALEAAHRLGVVHRDLKPGNVFLCDDATYKVLDFGMSKFAQAESLTQEGYTLGTPEYMSPEQCIGAPVDPRSDIYALGILMYEALTGDIPIQSRNRRDLLELHQREVPQPMRVRRPDLDISPMLDSIILSCLAKRAAQRPQTAKDLERLLANIPMEQLASTPPPESSSLPPPNDARISELPPRHPKRAHS